MANIFSTVPTPIPSVSIGHAASPAVAPIAAAPLAAAVGLVAPSVVAPVAAAHRGPASGVEAPSAVAQVAIPRLSHLLTEETPAKERVLTALPAAQAVPASGQASATTQNAVPAFITAASLASVSGGTAAVTTVWEVAKRLFGSSADTPWIPFVAALLVGTAIYVINIGDKDVYMSARERTLGMFIAFLNSLVLFSATVGIVRT